MRIHTHLIQRGKNFAPSTPSWAEISLKALQHNFLELKRLAGDAEVLPVVKANAYGHGLVPVSKALVGAGAKALAVATVREGVTLRNAVVTCPILILTPTLPAEIPTLLQYCLTPQVSSVEGARELAKVAKQMKVSRVPIHLKLDTGMGRVGVRVERAVREFDTIRRIPGIRVDAVYTHLATADWLDPKYAWKQITLFKQALDGFRKISGGKTFQSHMANSAALLAYYPQSAGTWVRPGLALYGVYPNQNLRSKAKLIPVMQVKTRIIHLKALDKGQSVSYGRTYTAKKPIKVATLSLGYADGVQRVLSNKAHFLVRGKRVPVIGRVCMDMTLIDVSKVPGVKLGDIATFFGRDGKTVLSVNEQATLAGTISYELLCAVGERVPRIYV